MKKIKLLIIIAIACVLAGCAKYTPEIKKHKVEKRNLVKNTNIKIVMLGDSETRRINYYWGIDTNWNTLMGFDTIMNYGYDAYTIGDILYNGGSSAPLYLAINENPDLICLMIGVNDAHYVPMNLTTSINNFRAIIDTIQAHNIDLVVQSIIPSTSSYVGVYNQVLNDQIRILNQNIYQICQQENVPYLDVRDGIVINNTSKAGARMRDDKSVDGIHLNYSGYEVWKNHLMSYLTDNGYL